VVGAQGSPYLEPDQWQLNVGYRYQFSDRHFTGSHEDTERQSGETQVKNTINLFDFALTRGLTKQTSITASVPFLIAKREIPGIIRDASGDLVRAPNGANTTGSQGIGDATITLRTYLFDVEKNLDQNIGLGFGIKLPTGDPSTTDAIKIRNTNGTPTDPTDDTFTNEVRTNDQSIQPGDGGFGFTLDLVAFKRWGLFTPYATGSYLFNPQGTNGVLTYRTQPGEEVMSIADQYLARIGTMIDAPQIEGLSFGIGGRIEGVPVRDLIGADDGFRRPGFAISAEPSVVFAHEKDVFSISIPIALYRNRQRSVSDQENGTHGDAAFADWMLLLSWSRQF
jgi:hypothetical protein